MYLNVYILINELNPSKLNVKKIKKKRRALHMLNIFVDFMNSELLKIIGGENHAFQIKMKIIDSVFTEKLFMCLI